MAIFNENGYVVSVGSNHSNSANSISDSQLNNLIESTLNEIIGAGIACDTILEAVDIKKAGGAILGAFKKGWEKVCSLFENILNWIKGITAKFGVLAKPDVIKKNFEDYKNYVKLAKKKIPENKYIKIMNGILRAHNEDPEYSYQSFNNASDIISSSISSMYNAELAYSKVSKILTAKNSNVDECIQDIQDMFSDVTYSEGSLEDAIQNLDINRVIELSKKTTLGSYTKSIQNGIKNIKKIVKNIDSTTGKWDETLNDYGSADKQEVINSLKNACRVTTLYGTNLIRFTKDVSQASLSVCKFFAKNRNFDSIGDEPEENTEA